MFVGLGVVVGDKADSGHMCVSCYFERNGWCKRVKVDEESLSPELFTVVFKNTAVAIKLKGQWRKMTPSVP